MTIRGGTIINISGTTPIEDPSYRYKMPAVYGKVEGSGNGIKTAIPNITEVGLSLHRSPQEVCKFFGTELGAQTTYNVDNDKAVVNGSHTDGVLQDLVHRYIDKFVSCPNCNLPETVYKIKTEIIYHKCAACGAKEMVDMTHKLCKFILAEDKKVKKAAKGKNKKDDKKKKKKGDADSDDEKKKKKKKDKDKKLKKEKKGKDGGDEADYIKEALVGGKKDEDGLDLGSDDEVSLASEAGVDDEGAFRRFSWSCVQFFCSIQCLMILSWSLILTNIFIWYAELAVEATKKFLLDNPNASPKEIAEVVTNQQMASALKSQQKVHIFVQAAFTPSFFKNKEVEKYSKAIVAITNENRIMERHLISALELFCLDKPKNFPVLIKQLYDEDALDEVAILDWADEGRTEFTSDAVDEDARAALRGEAEPVVVWLQDEDSDDEASDEE